jgi:PAS domain S-box-containing protein
VNAVSIPERKPGASLTPRWRSFPLACVILGGVALSLTAFFFARSHEQERIEQEFTWRARSHLESLRANLDRFEECVYTLRDIFQASADVTLARFSATAEDLRHRHPGVQVLEWIPLVRRSERATFEATGQSQVIPNFRIFERNDQNTAWVRSPDRPEYAPVLYVDPLAPNAVALGFDTYRGLDQQTIFRARDSGMVTASRRLALRGAGIKEYGWIYFLPCYGKGPEPATVEERQSRLQGYVAGVFRLSDWVVHSYAGISNPAVETLIVDETPGASEPFLVSYTGNVGRTADAVDQTGFRAGPHRAFNLKAGGRDWTVYFRPAPVWLVAQSTFYPQASLIVGLLMTGLVAFIVFHAQRRAALVVQMVEDRTVELRTAQEMLRGDIRRREIVEHALRQSEDRYRAFVEQSTEGIWCFELDPPISTYLPIEEQIDLLYRNSHLAECNDVMARMYGYDRAEQILGHPLEAFLPRADPQASEYFHAFIENGYRIHEWECREVNKHGESRFFLNNGTGIIEDGVLKRSWGTQRDITERKQQAELQHEQATRLRLAVSAANLGTWDWDLVGGSVIWSPETERIFGLEPGTFDGKLETYLGFLYPEDRERIGIVIRHALATPGETGTDYELRTRRQDGTTRWLVARGALLRDAQGKAVRMIGTVMDVTAQHLAEEERKQMERKLQESQKLESLGILAGGIAHDFNNLLTGILGNASFARLDIPANSPAQTSLEQIELAAQRAADLCKQMLAYSGKGRFVVQRLDLNAVVRETADLLQVSVSKSAVLNYALAPNLPAISADATQIRQILMNLVINASEAIGGRSGFINIVTGVLHADRPYLTEAYLSPNIPEGDYVYLEVSDNGAGMDAATCARIFDPFFTTKFTGRGLGLAAVLGIVRGHQGALKVYSEPGQGTTFRLLLPSTEGPADLPPPNPVVAPPWRGSGTLLIVDDEETVRTTTARMVERLGFAPLLATDGIEALEIFHREGAHIAGVLLDLTMPILDGNATFTELRRLDPELSVLLMSGFNEQDAVHRFAGQGLAGFIQKPFKLETLREKLQAIFADAGDDAGACLAAATASAGADRARPEER